MGGCSLGYAESVGAKWALLLGWAECMRGNVGWVGDALLTDTCPGIHCRVLSPDAFPPIVQRPRGRKEGESEEEGRESEGEEAGERRERGAGGLQEAVGVELKENFNTFHAVFHRNFEVRCKRLNPALDKWCEGGR